MVEQKGLFNHGMATDLGEWKLNLNQFYSA